MDILHAFSYVQIFLMSSIIMMMIANFQWWRPVKCYTATPSIITHFGTLFNSPSPCQMFIKIKIWHVTNIMPHIFSIYMIIELKTFKMKPVAQNMVKYCSKLHTLVSLKEFLSATTIADRELSTSTTIFDQNTSYFTRIFHRLVMECIICY